MEAADTQRLRREQSLLGRRELDRELRPRPAYDWSTILRVEKLDVLLQGLLCGAAHCLCQSDQI
jgi:hypothetical protein